jgi:hypothetical protein
MQLTAGRHEATRQLAPPLSGMPRGIARMLHPCHEGGPAPVEAGTDVRPFR